MIGKQTQRDGQEDQNVAVGLATRPRVDGENHDQRGVALVLAIVMLALLGMLGALVLSSSSTDLKIAGNFRSERVSLFTADAVVASLQKDATVRSSLSGMTTLVTGTVDVGTGANKHKAPFRVVKAFVGLAPTGTGYNAVITDVTGTKNKAENQVTYVVIQTTGQVQNGGESSVEAMVGWVQ